ncbi:MAG: preprotein translocase subunit YajC [Alphaproteobacteria bacterium]
MLISPAYAQVPGTGGGFDFTAILPLVLIFVVFYFLLIRPQQRKAKEHKSKVSGIRRGDKVVTGGGIVGTIARANEGDAEVLVEIADGVRVRVMRQTISDVMAKGQPAAGDKDESESQEKGGNGSEDKKLKVHFGKKAK